MKNEIVRFVRKHGEFAYTYKEFTELNFHDIVIGKCKDIDEILPKDGVYFAIFYVEKIGGFIISKFPPPVTRNDSVCKYKKFYITSLSSF